MNAEPAPRWGREHGSRALVRLMIRIATTLGWRVGNALLVPITFYFLLTSREICTASRDYLRRVTGRPAKSRDVYRHLFVFASVMLDRVFLLSGRLRGFRIDIEGSDELDAALDHGRGCILIGAHLGSFDALRAAGRTAPAPVHPLMSLGNRGATTALLEALDPGLAASVIPTGRPDTMLLVKACLDRGEMVGILADRPPALAGEGRDRMIETPFLGDLAPFPAGPFIVAALAEAPVLLFHGIRLGPRRYVVRFEPFATRISLNRATRQADLEYWIGRFATRLETACRAHPLNWFNFYPFWERSHAPRAAGADPDLGDDTPEPAVADPRGRPAGWRRPRAGVDA